MKYPKIRKLDGCYFRVCRDDKWHSLCFTDLTKEEQKSVLNGKDVQFLESLVLYLAETLRTVGDLIDIMTDDEEVEEDA